MRRISESHLRGQPSANPDPSRFKIMRHLKIRSFLIAKVNYPNCINFEGNKILVFKDITFNDISRLRLLDPHFSSSENTISPIARFTPTEQGWEYAVKFCESA